MCYIRIHLNFLGRRRSEIAIGLLATEQLRKLDEKCNRSAPTATRPKCALVHFLYYVGSGFPMQLRCSCGWMAFAITCRSVPTSSAGPAVIERTRPSIGVRTVAN